MLAEEEDGEMREKILELSGKEPLLTVSAHLFRLSNNFAFIVLL